MKGTFEIVHIRTPAVQHKKLTKKMFSRLYINGSTQERKNKFVKNFCVVLSVVVDNKNIIRAQNHFNEQVVIKF